VTEDGSVNSDYEAISDEDKRELCARLMLLGHADIANVLEQPGCRLELYRRDTLVVWHQHRGTVNFLDDHERRQVLEKNAKKIFGPEIVVLVMEDEPDADEGDEDQEPEPGNDPDSAGAEPDSAQPDPNEANSGPENAQSDDHQGADAPRSNRAERGRQANAQRKAEKRPKVNYAVAWARHGFPVFPCQNLTDNGNCTCGDLACGSKGKHPRVEHWKEDATADEKQIRAWWARYPDANIGVPCGPQSGITVVDVDGQIGIETRRALEQEFGEWITPHALTGSGGEHWIFAYIEGLTNSVKSIPGIDVRTQGGYIVAVGSKTSDFYRWAEGWSLKRSAAHGDAAGAV
jgi:hypothetical protein